VLEALFSIDCHDGVFHGPKHSDGVTFEEGKFSVFTRVSEGAEKINASSGDARISYILSSPLPWFVPCVERCGADARFGKQP
jgi:hypothetical protein